MTTQAVTTGTGKQPGVSRQSRRRLDSASPQCQCHCDTVADSLVLAAEPGSGAMALCMRVRDGFTRPRRPP